jgi:hypothetical protein
MKHIFNREFIILGNVFWDTTPLFSAYFEIYSIPNEAAHKAPTLPKAIKFDSVICIFPQAKRYNFFSNNVRISNEISVI